MIRPTGQGVALIAGAVPIALFAAVLAPAAAAVALIYLAAVVLVLTHDARALPKPGTMPLQPVLPDRLYMGRDGRMGVAVAAEGARLPLFLEIKADLDDRVRPIPVLRTQLMPGEAVELSTDLHPVRRGTARLRTVWLRWRTRLDLMSRTETRTEGWAVEVWPDIQGVKETARLLSSRGWLIGQRAQRQLGDGSEFDALREYVPGLDPRALDWKRSAHHRTLVCKEFQAERNHQIVLAVDTGQLMSEPLDGLSRLDHALNGALQLAYMALKAGDRVAMLGFDSKVRGYLPPVAGMRGFEQVQQQAAALDYRTEESNFALAMAGLAGKLKRRSLIVLMTDFVDTITAELMVEHVGALAHRHLILFVAQSNPRLTSLANAAPDDVTSVGRAVFARSFLSERRAVLQRLRRLGVEILETEAGRIGPGLIDQYLRIKQRDLV